MIYKGLWKCSSQCDTPLAPNFTVCFSLKIGLSVFNNTVGQDRMQKEKMKKILELHHKQKTVHVCSSHPNPQQCDFPSSVL